MPAVVAPNPFVLALLRSPLHRLASGALLVLEVTGRKTGRTLVFPVMYARDGEGIVIVAAWASKKRWWKNVLGGAEVGLLVAGERLRGEARVVDDGAERGRLLRAYLARFPSAAKGLGLPKEASSVDDATLSSRLSDAVVVRVAPSGAQQGQSK